MLTWPGATGDIQNIISCPRCDSTTALLYFVLEFDIQVLDPEECRLESGHE